MLNLDPALLDQDKIRKDKRKRLLKHSILPIIILVGASLYFFSTWIYNIVFSVSFGNKNYPIADGFTETRFVSNVVEPYIADYDQGVARLAMGQYPEAEGSFMESLKKSPIKERLCQIYVNLSLSIEFQADAFLQQKNYPRVIELYNRAKATLYNNGCAEEGAQSGGKDRKAEMAEQRLADKINSAIDSMNHTTTGDDDPYSGAEDKQITDQALEDIRNGLIFGGYHAGYFITGVWTTREDLCLSRCW